MNARHPLTLTTPEGSGQAVHPDVIRIEGGFAGHPYWMAFTPYPFGNDRLENPCVRVSKDGLIWDSVADGPDPVCDTPVEPGRHHADTELAFWGNRLFLVFMTTTVGKPNAVFSYKTTLDGRSWSAARPICNDDWIVSPCLIIDETGCRFWYVQCNAEADPPASLLLHRSGPSLEQLEPAQACALHVPGQVVWHIDIISSGDGFEALVTAFPRGKDPSRSRLFHAHSHDGIKFEISGSQPIVTPTVFGWDNRMIYRSTFIREDSNYRVWYSAASWGMRCGIGYLQGRIDNLRDPRSKQETPGAGPMARLGEDAIGVLKYLILRNAPEWLIDSLRKLVLGRSN